MTLVVDVGVTDSSAIDVSMIKPFVFVWTEGGPYVVYRSSMVDLDVTSLGIRCDLPDKNSLSWHSVARAVVFIAVFGLDR